MKHAIETGHKYAVYEQHVAFWGNVFSNYHQCEFIYKGLRWKSSEQAYMAEKAIYFGDYASFVAILNTDSPADAKAIGRAVKGFDAEIWNEVSYNIMYNIVFEKFYQNKDCKDMLLRKDLKDKSFVEGSPVDAIWGVKISWDDPDIDDESNWKGENRLGKVLNQVREDLLKQTLF